MLRRQFENLGDDFWSAAATLTTIGSPLYPVTAAGKIIALLLIVYAVSAFTYFVGSIASVLVGHGEAQPPVPRGGITVHTTPDEVRAVRALLKRLPAEDSE